MQVHEVDGIVFLVDVSDRERGEEAGQALHRLLNDERVSTAI